MIKIKKKVGVNLGEDLKRRSSKTVSEYAWLVTLADELHEIEMIEYFLFKNKEELRRWDIGGDLNNKFRFFNLDGSRSERRKARIELAELELLQHYKFVKNFIDELYSFDGLKYRVLYEFLTTPDSLYEIGKRLKTTTLYVKDVLKNIDQDIAELFLYDDFTYKHSKLEDTDFCVYMRRRYKNMLKKIKK